MGNFPGVTVDQKIGEIRSVKNCSVVDLPGIYSIRPYTNEEIVTRDFILNEKPDGIINIVDATNIERNLYLTLQLLEMHIPMVLALNMMDEVRENGGSIIINRMEEMLGICQQKEVSIVGAKLYYPDDTIQHAGVVLGLGGIAGHVMCRASREDAGYFGRMVSVQEISAVTAACMLVDACDFWAVGGFDESFRVAFNDIDLCMKIRDIGRKIVFTPYAELYHYESKSRGLEDTPEKQYRFEKEITRFREKWEDQLKKRRSLLQPQSVCDRGRLFPERRLRNCEVGYVKRDF